MRQRRREGVYAAMHAENMRCVHNDATLEMLLRAARA